MTRCALAVGIALFFTADLGAQRRVPTEEYDDAFRKYSKRYFGVAFDWRHFKAQGMAESQLVPTARSYVGARGIMQLMPSTFQIIQTAKPEFLSIDDPEWNIAAGIMHDRYLWTLWKGHKSDEERLRFMFASYNAGEGPILRAQGLARASQMDHRQWTSIRTVAPKVGRWRYRETLGYVDKIQDNHRKLCSMPVGRRRFLSADSVAAPAAPTLDSARTP